MSATSSYFNYMWGTGKKGKIHHRFGVIHAFSWLWDSPPRRCSAGEAWIDGACTACETVHFVGWCIFGTAVPWAKFVFPMCLKSSAICSHGPFPCLGHHGPMSANDHIYLYIYIPIYIYIYVHILAVQMCIGQYCFSCFFYIPSLLRWSSLSSPKRHGKAMFSSLRENRSCVLCVFFWGGVGRVITLCADVLIDMMPGCNMLTCATLYCTFYCTCAHASC